MIYQWHTGLYLGNCAVNITMQSYCSSRKIFMIITFVYTAEVSQTALLEFAALTMIDEILFYESTGCTMKTSTHRLKSLSLFFGEDAGSQNWLWFKSLLSYFNMDSPKLHKKTFITDLPWYLSTQIVWLFPTFISFTFRFLPQNNKAKEIYFFWAHSILKNWINKLQQQRLFPGTVSYLVLCCAVNNNKQIFIHLHYIDIFEYNTIKERLKQQV